jgi:hypothetical protein
LLRSQLGDALDRLPKVEGTGGEVHIGNDLSRLRRNATISTYRASSSYLLRSTGNHRWHRRSNRPAPSRGLSHNRSTSYAVASRSLIRMRRTPGRRSRNTRSI